MPARTSPGLTRSASDVEGPGQSDEKWATGTNHKWTRKENLELMECYFNSRPNERGYMERMERLWVEKRPTSTLTKKQLGAQRYNIVKRKLLSNLEIEQLHLTSQMQGRSPEKQLGIQQPGETPDTQTTTEAKTSSPPSPLQSSSADMRNKIMSKLATINTRVRLPRLSKELPSDSMLKDANKALMTIPTTNITQTNKVIYATAVVILEMLGYSIKQGNNISTQPPWKMRLEANIKTSRREVSQLAELQKGVKVKNKSRILRKYQGLTLPEALETAKQRLTALAARLKRYTREAEARRINALFSKEPSKVYSQLQCNNKVTTEPPVAETEQYWKNIWENKITHNTSAKWLKELKTSHSNLPEQEPVTITTEDVQQRIRNMKSWTAPGPDMIQTYWLKRFTALHERLAEQMNQLLAAGSHPGWLTQGRTVLIQKDPQKGTTPSNYRPITCLSTTWKVLSGIIATKLQKHMSQYMSTAQKGIGKDTRGSKHQLLIDSTVAQDSRTRQTNLCTAWIDYRKAYDSMPHTWICECLALYKVNKTLMTFLKNSMGQWKTTLEVNTKEIAQVSIKRGIYQGDALSPLLFCIGLNPLSQIIAKTGYGYKFKSGTTISHLLYMDDIKLYAKNERDIDSLIHLTRIYSEDIGMSFGLDKCSRMIVKRGKVVKTSGVELPTGYITDVETTYKYLGIPQSHGNHEEEARKTAISKYHQRIRQILKSQLNGKNKIHAINTYALPVIRYPAGIVSWPQTEMEAADVKTRKLLTMHGGFHPKSNIQRLYTSRKEGGRGLISIKTTILDETQNIQEYISKMAPKDELMRECLQQQQQQQIRKEDQTEEVPWQDKTLHGMYHRQITEVADIEKSYQWLEKAGFKDSTEALIMAAQEQALRTRSIEAGIYHTREDPKCRLCRETSETIQHIVAGCKMQAGTAYTERHNQVAGIVYRNICSAYGLTPPKTRWETPQKIVENDRAKVLWDFHIQTDKKILANQPDIVVVDKAQKTALVIDVSIPNDSNIKKKEHEKVEKYQGLKEELERLWQVKVNVIPIVIGALGAVTSKLEEWLRQIPGGTSQHSIQKSALLGTAKILRRTLKLPGLW